MKITVIGGNGLIGSKLVRRFRDEGHEVVAASPRTGVNTLTGEGLARALEDAAVTVDVTNSPSFEAAAVMDFFQRSTRNLLEFGKSAGVGHLVALSVVGTDRLPSSGYFRAKLAQETLIREAGLPYSIVRATQFFEFVKSIVEAGARDGKVWAPPALIQPIAAEDVARAVGDVALGSPVNGVVDIAGPEAFRLDDLVRRSLRATGDARRVVTDEQTGYFGAVLAERTLVPEGAARLGQTRFEVWMANGR